jgi:hypothetical protein
MAIRGTVDAQLIVDPGLRNFFNNALSKSQQKSMMMKAYKKSANPLVKATKQNLRARRKTRNVGSSLYKSIGVKPNRRRMTMHIGARTYRNFDGNHGHLVNYGTKQRYRKTRGGRRVPVGRMPAMNFWTDALQQTSNTVGNTITSNLEATLLDWTRKKGIRV